MLREFEKDEVYWTKKMNLKLIKYIENKPHIWNPRHPKYTSVNDKDKTYAEFAANFGGDFTGQVVKDRWTNIRTTFAYYLRKVKASKIKDGEVYKVNWPLWKACQFLMKVKKKPKIPVDVCDEGNNIDQTSIEEQIWSDHDSYISENEDASLQSKCQDIAEGIHKVFKGVQCDSFGLNNTKYGQIGKLVTERLSQMSTLEAARMSMKIMEILLYYEENNLEDSLS